MRTTISKVAWEILQKEFQGDLKVKNVNLQTFRRELENLKIKESESIKDYYTRVMDIINQMRGLGEVVEDSRVVEKILASLPPKYDYMVSIIEETKDIASLTVQELMGSLKAHEKRLERHSEKSIESAFQSKLSIGSKEFEKNGESSDKKRGESFRGGRNGGGQGRGRGRGCSGGGRNNFEGGRQYYERRGNSQNPQACKICGKSGHSVEDCWFKGKPKCYRCQKFWHKEKECRVKNLQQTANFMEEKESEGNMFYACQSATEYKNDVWYLDNGCSNHMTGDKSILWLWILP
ncbi:uncharacterized protein LOC141614589 [Silene latifolia]|uniref:uncharacterized protein LOC141614589 n=1 Tax=Silene latifolia TaxID=37657 RepID=UPI003D7868BB